MRNEGRGAHGAGSGVKRLALVHIGPHLSGHGAMEKGIGDAREIYDGELVFSEELMTIEM